MYLNFLKLATRHVFALSALLVLLCIYFFPQLLGKKLVQSDVTNFRCMAQEVIQHRKETGKETYWTNSMFGGMPTYQISMLQSSNYIQYLSKISRLFIKGPIGLFFAYMVGGYLMLVLLKIDFRVAFISAFAFAFSTYNILLLDAGHHTKINTVGFLGIILAGLHLVFEQKKDLFGGLIIAIGMGLSTNANHIQMTYYFLLLLVVYGIILLIHNFKAGNWPAFLKRIVIVVFAALIGLLTASEMMIPSFEYHQDTMRGKPLLLSKGSGAGSSSGVDGLNWDYAMKWSHKPLDLLAMIIPGAAGGGIESVKPNSRLSKDLIEGGYQDDKIYLYWGGLDFTSGPPYFSIVFWFFLFYFLIISKGPIRWWIAAAIILLSFMSLGKFFEGFNKVLFEALPLLNRFRAPGSISAVIAIPVTLGGGLGINHFLFKNLNPKLKWNCIKWTGMGFAVLLFVVILGGLSFNSFQAIDDSSFEKAGILDIIINARRSLFVDSGIRSLFFVGLCLLTSWLIYKKWIKSTYGLLVLGLVAYGDLWLVNNQYFTYSKFIESNLADYEIKPRPVDDLIAQDENIYFRVYDKTVDPFKSSKASYFHKSIGGFSPAKLLRYQDMIDQYLVLDDQKVLNMLNTRYIISNQNDTQTAVINEAALGNAWFVNDFTLVKDAQEEIDRIAGIEPAKTAIVHKEFNNYVQGLNLEKHGKIRLTGYAPDQLVYISNSDSEQLAVFSDIWYGPNKGWNAYVDGEKVEHIRANFILRALRVPAGDHTIEFKFEPKTVKVGSIISLITSLGLIGGLILLSVSEFRKLISSHNRF